MERIAVIGCGGSGKTTLARELSLRMGLPLIHIDDAYWRRVDGRRIESTAEQWQIRHRELISGDRWVIDGMKLGVLPERLAAADAVVFLDLSTAACLWGILSRRVRYRDDRPDLGVYPRIRWEFIRWVWSFRRSQRPTIAALLAGFDGQVNVLSSRREARQFLDAISRHRLVADQTNASGPLPVEPKLWS